MIVVDTSALMAIVLNEAAADSCLAVLANEEGLVMSGATMAEALIVADRRNVRSEVKSVIEGLQIEIAPVTADMAHRVSNAYMRWGKGVRPAGLNFGDCFAYALAEERNCRLLYVGSDFAQTDIASVL